MASHPLILFIVKRSYQYCGDVLTQVSTGLKTSAGFIVDLLLMEGFRAKLVEAIDGNCIDALVSQNSPTKVVIEAIWVTPCKLAELKRLHPKVKWTVRIHSETPFLAQEGVAVEWISEYLKMGVEVAFNSENTVQDFSILGKSKHLPNYYPIRKPRPLLPRHPEEINVGCFGAIRPLKNQLIQAFGAIIYANRIGKRLVFHMNANRIEQQGNNNLKNIKSLFEASGQTLVLHDWKNHVDFLELISTMDICLQVSLSESFNIVSADAVSMGIPLVGSSSISWLPELAQADVDSAESIAETMDLADNTMVLMNQEALRRYLLNVVRIWAKWASN